MNGQVDLPPHLFTRVVRDGILNADELAVSLIPLAASARAAGVHDEDLTAFIIAVTRRGGQPSYMLDGLRQLFDNPAAWQAVRCLLDESRGTR